MKTKVLDKKTPVSGITTEREDKTMFTDKFQVIDAGTGATLFSTDDAALALRYILDHEGYYVRWPI